MRDVILTGIPRAGTTLASALVDSLPDTLCLNEPGWQNAQVAKTAQGFANFIAQDFDKLRRHILAGNPIPDRRGEDGAAITNYFTMGAEGVMRNNYTMMPLLRPELTPNFTLAVKHNAPYLAILPELIAMKRFRIIAIIREPLAVIRSWRRLQLPISYGDLPNARPYWPALNNLIESKMELLEKQVRLYEMLLGRILQHEGEITIIRYEDLTANPSLIANALDTKNAHLPPLVQPQKAETSAEDEQICDAIKNYALLACGLWPR